MVDIVCKGKANKVFTRIFSKISTSILHHQYRYFSDEGSLGNMSLEQLTYLRLLGLGERAMHNMVKLIENGNLDTLGKKLNSMIKSKYARDHNYGFAGLEGIYINENILGLLQVLANRVRKMKGKEEIPVVCNQQEIYKENSSRDSLLPLDPKIKNEYQTFLQDNEFYCQIDFLNSFQHVNFPRTQTPLINLENCYNNKIRDVSGLDSDPKYYGKKYIDWVNNYNYNKIFNIDDPPIKKVLEPYIESIDNFYLFFVVSNNKKKDPDTGKFDIETCDKQMKLLHDTRHFMSVIAEDDPSMIRCEL
jgi:hypothetical protein